MEPHCRMASTLAGSGIRPSLVTISPRSLTFVLRSSILLIPRENPMEMQTSKNSSSSAMCSMTSARASGKFCWYHFLSKW